MRSSDVDLVEVGDAAVASGDGDVLELNVHVVLGFEELSAVCLARRDFEGDDVTLCLIEELDRDANGGSHCGGLLGSKPWFWHR